MKLKNAILLSLTSSLIYAGNINFNQPITLKIKGQIKVKNLLKLLFPNYNIITYDNSSQKVLNKIINNVNYHNFELKELLKSLEYKINSYIEINPTQKIINISQYKVFRYHLPINGPISVSTTVELGSGGGTPPSVNTNGIYGGSGTNNKGSINKNPLFKKTITPKQKIINPVEMKNPQRETSKSSSGNTQTANSGGSTIQIQNTGLSGLIKILRSILSPDERLYFDIKTGLLQLMIKPQTEIKVNELLEPILKVRREQIKVTMKVIEFTKTKVSAHGISWNKFWNNIVNGISVSAAMQLLKVNDKFGNITYTNTDNNQFPLGIKVSGSNGQSEAFIGLLNQFGNVKVVSEPSVILRNGETVIINNGEEITYIKNTQAQQSQDGTSISYTPGKLLNGFRLILNANVENIPGQPPKIVLFLAPILQTTLSLDTVGNAQTGLIQLPKTDTRSISLYTTLKNGSTQVIGGFKQIYTNKTTNGVPILDKIPLISDLFSYKENNKKSKRILFIVSAHVINDNNF